MSNQRSTGEFSISLYIHSPFSRTRDSGEDGLHFETLFDENETPSGDLCNLATGQRIDNSTTTDRSLLEKMGCVIEHIGQHPPAHYGDYSLSEIDSLIKEAWGTNTVDL